MYYIRKDGDNMNLEYLKECRKKKFKNQTSAAEHIGLSFDMYSSIEMGRRTGTIDTIVKICKALEIDVKEII